MTVLVDFKVPITIAATLILSYKYEGDVDVVFGTFRCTSDFQ